LSSSRLPELIDIGPGAAKRLAAFCASRSRAPLRLVADRNTWAAMGMEAERELLAAGLAARATVFDEPYLAAERGAYCGSSSTTIRRSGSMSP